MTTPRRWFQFRLRTMLLLTAMVACFLGWRMRDPERAAVVAIGAARGRVHYQYHSPQLSTSWISVAMLPGYEYYSQFKIVDFGPAEPPPQTAMQFVFGSHRNNRVSCVELKFEQLTPEMIAQLKSLSALHMLIVDMPAGMMKVESDEVQRLHAIQKEFDGQVYPAFNRGYE